MIHDIDSISSTNYQEEEVNIKLHVVKILDTCSMYLSLGFNMSSNAPNNPFNVNVCSDWNCAYGKWARFGYGHFWQVKYHQVIPKHSV